MKNKYLMMLTFVCILAVFFAGCRGKENTNKTSNNKDAKSSKENAEIVNKTTQSEIKVTADKIIIASDVWQPYAGEAGKELGSMVEVAIKGFEKVGLKAEYVNLPWDRAIEECRNGNINGIIASAYEVEDFIVGKISVGESGVSLFTKKGKEFKFVNTDSLKDKKFGGILNYDYGFGLSKLLEESDEKSNPNVIAVKGVNSVVSLIKMLADDRIDVMPEDRDVFIAISKKLGLNSQDFAEIVLPNSYGDCNICFSPKIEKSKEYAKKLDEGIELLRESGELEKILNKYNLKDWDR